jgi:hypothetical protein
VARAVCCSKKRENFEWNYNPRPVRQDLRASVSPW